MRRQLPLSLHVLPAIAFIAVASLGAQNGTAPSSSSAHPGKARILGAVIDSLNGGTLAGAEVLVEGARASAFTDSSGKFELDDLPPGMFQLGVFHPLLDTLSLSILTRPFHVGPDSTVVVVMSVPSAATIIHERCPTTQSASGTSAVIGHVTDPESLRPVEGAEVSISWVDLEVSKSVGIRHTPHLVRATTDKLGEYRFCGLPNAMQATLQARHGTAATAVIPIALGDRPVELGARTLLLASVDSTTKTGNASVSGVVLLADGAASAGSRVELVGTPAVVLTNARGEFSMRNLPSGSRILLARHVGYSPQIASVDLSSHEQPHITMKLPKYVSVMDPVLVLARHTAALDKVGFNVRRKSANGYFIGPERLQHLHPMYITDALRMVPGLRIVRGQWGDAVESSHNIGGDDCVQYYVDDMQYTEIEPGDVNSFISGGEIVAIEVYQGGMAPAQYMRAASNCTTIVMWTRFKVGT
jgi:hypothetical protein